MKNLLCAGMALLCPLLYLHAFCQPPVKQSLASKPLLFSRLPDRTLVTPLQLRELFSSTPPQHIKIPMGTNNWIEGVVTDKIVRNKNVTSLTIQCTNYDGALLTLSRITGTDDAETYIGRVVNIRYGDVLVLTRENNSYILSKQKQSLVIVE